LNTDQGTQLTSGGFTTILHDHGVAISMDSPGCWRDNVFVERLWRTIKYEEICLHAYPRPSARPKPASGATSSSTTVDAHTPRWATELRTRHTSPIKTKTTQPDRDPG